MFNITDKGINILINNIEQQENKYFWIRTPDFQQQIYISEGFEKIWQNDNSKLFEHPMSFVDTFIIEENEDILKSFEARAMGAPDEREKTLLVRIKSADNSIIHWRDSCFCLYDTYGTVVGVAGIGEALKESEWFLDLEKKVEEPTQLEIIKKSQFARYLQNDKPDSIPFNNIEIPCHRIKSQYYVFIVPEGEIALTRRELQCIYYLLAGFTAKQTARELKISPKVVEEYLNNARGKLHCNNKMEIVKKIKHIVR